MGKKQREIAEMGVIAIVREAFVIFSNHSKSLISIQVVLGLPCVLLSVYFQGMLALHQPHFIPASPGLVHPSYFNRKLGRMLSEDDDFSFLPFIKLIFIGPFLFQLAESLSIAATIHTVGLIYTDSNIGFLDIIKAVVPRLWHRLAVTLFLKQCLSTSLVILCGLMIGLGSLINLPVFLLIIPVVGAIAAVGYVALTAMVASGVCVLEDDFGWAAFEKGKRLLEGRVGVAIRVKVLFSILFALAVRPWSGIQAELLREPCNPVPYLWAVPYVVWATMAHQLNAISSAVTYVSCKACHNENIVGSHIFDDLAKGGYQIDLTDSVSADKEPSV